MCLLGERLLHLYRECFILSPSILWIFSWRKKRTNRNKGKGEFEKGFWGGFGIESPSIWGITWIMCTKLEPIITPSHDWFYLWLAPSVKHMLCYHVITPFYTLHQQVVQNPFLICPFLISHLNPPIIIRTKIEYLIVYLHISCIVSISTL